MNTVFVSYSHKDEVWKDRLLPQLNSLVLAGVGMKVWQDRQIDGGATWSTEIEDAMRDSAAAILLISANYLSSGFCVNKEVPFFLEQRKERGMLVLPVLIRPCPWKHHRWLAAIQMLPRDGKSVAVDFPGDHADTVLCEVADAVCAHLETLTASASPGNRALPDALPALGAPHRLRARSIEPIPPAAALAATPSPYPDLPADRVDLTRLPETGAALFGRDRELQLLDDAWAGEGEAETRVLVFTAQGGVGKSTLVNRWLAEMRRDRFRGAARVFGWSFYSQGAHDQTASAEPFIAAALRFFGDPNPAEGSPWDKGERLARLVGGERALLALDGMEPLQSGQTFDRGRLRDPGLLALLRGLARTSTGLCVVTTREPLADLADRPGVVARDLEQIGPQDGRALLRTARVVGTDAELEGLASRFGPHALAISLLGVYLREHPGRGIEPARELEALPGATPIDRVLQGLERWLSEGAELETLRLLGFFDRPANEGCLGALREPPAITGLTDRLTGLSGPEWDGVLARLEKLRLIHIRQIDGGKRLVDSHPLIREHFAQQLREGKPEAWRAGHRRLYEHLKTTTPDKPEPTLEDLQPLYQAVAHGCQAGLYQEVRRFHYDRILRGREGYAVRRLAALGAELGAVACFFERSWSKPVSVLTKRDRAWLLNAAAFRLRAMGWFSNALEPIRLGLEMLVGENDWKHAARVASNLSELELTLGQASRAVSESERSVSYADRSLDPFQRMSKRASQADALHQAGRAPDALELFREAERMQAEREPEHPLLSSVRGFRYCDLLLAPAERAAWLATMGRAVSGAGERGDSGAGSSGGIVGVCVDVANRAATTLEVALRSRCLLDIGLDHLTLGRVVLYRALLTGSDPRTAHAAVEAAMEFLRSAGQQQCIPLGLLTRAWYRRQTGEPSAAQADLDEAWEIAERGSMKLFQADIHLHRARLFFRATPYPWPDRSPQADLAAARQLIESCGYWRRKQELEDAEKVIGGSNAR